MPTYRWDPEVSLTTPSLANVELYVKYDKRQKESQTDAQHTQLTSHLNCFY
jgi:hypothetical protein